MGPSHKYVCWCAERDIAAGEQILISYGELSDARLLQTYGALGQFCSIVCAGHRYKCRLLLCAVTNLLRL